MPKLLGSSCGIPRCVPTGGSPSIPRFFAKAVEFLASGTDWGRHDAAGARVRTVRARGSLDTVWPVSSAIGGELQVWLRWCSQSEVASTSTLYANESCCRLSRRYGDSRLRGCRAGIQRDVEPRPKAPKARLRPDLVAEQGLPGQFGPASRCCDASDESCCRLVLGQPKDYIRTGRTPLGSSGGGPGRQGRSIPQRRSVPLAT